MLMTKDHKNKLNYIYKINENGEVCYFFDVTLLKFKLLLNSLGEAHNINRSSKYNFFYEYNTNIFSKNKHILFISLLKKNKLESVLFFDIIHMVSNLKVYSTLTYNNYYINSIIFLNWYNNPSFLLLDNLFFNYN